MVRRALELRITEFAIRQIGLHLKGITYFARSTIVIGTPPANANTSVMPLLRPVAAAISLVEEGDIIEICGQETWKIPADLLVRPYRIERAA